MSEQQDWNDETREDLRASIRTLVRGEVRFRRYGPKAFLKGLREFFPVECPADEYGRFEGFAATELKLAVANLHAEELTWPGVTDCDRLDRVETELRKCGILFWQASPCCDTCTKGELADRVAEIDELHAGFAEIVRGYAFYIDQGLPEMLAENTKLSLYLGYGRLLEIDDSLPEELLDKLSLAVGREVCECLQKQGIHVDWDGDVKCKIAISVNWQRRNLLQ